MRTACITAGFTFVLFCEAYTQDFRKVTEIVGPMESSLRNKIAAETSERRSEVDSLRGELARLKIRSQSSEKTSENTIDSLGHRIALMESKLSDHRADVDLSQMISQLSDLASEMKKTFGDGKAPAKPTVATAPSLIKVGLLAQFQGQALEEQATAVQDVTPGYSVHWQRQMFMRRVRVLVGGDIATSTSFFVESDATNIGKVDVNGAKSAKVSMYIQDAYLQQTIAPELSVIAGLQLVGTTRNSLQSAASLMALDYGSYQFVTSTPLDNTAGRDVGVNLRGFLFDERLEYRAGVFSGKNLNLYSPLRTVVRLNYMLEDREKGFFYTGTTLSKGRLMSVGAGFDFQGSYKSYSLDGMMDLPAGRPGSLTASASVSFLDGGGSDADSTFFTGAIPRQTIVFSEVGYLFNDWGIQPYVKYESENVNATVARQVGATTATLDRQNKLRSKSRFGIGVNYFLKGHNANIKALYELSSWNRQSLNPSAVESASNGEFTVQLQYYVF